MSSLSRSLRIWLSRRRSVLALLVVLTGLNSAVTASDDDRVAEQIVVELLPGASIPAIEQQYHVHRIDSIDQLLTMLAVADPGYDVDTIVAQMNAGSPGNGIEEAEPHRRLENPEGGQISLPILDRSANTDKFLNQPAAQTIHRAAAHQIERGDGVMVAILDNGVNTSHPEFAGRIVRLPGANFADGAPDNIAPQPDGIDNDLDGSIDEALDHGTLVAGMVRLAAPGARLLPVRVMDEEGRGEAFDIARGILFAIKSGAKVINCSFGMLFRSGVIAKAIDAADDAGVVVIASAGNRNRSSVDYPADDNSVIAVAAVDDNKVKAPWSSYGSKVDLTAPGIQPLSTFIGNDFAKLDGTSFAAPQVAGGAALLLDRYPCLTPPQVRSLLRSTAQPDNNGSAWNGLLGTGTLDLDALAHSLTKDRCSLKLQQSAVGTVARWSPVQGESNYDLIRGDIGGLYLSGSVVHLGALLCLQPPSPATNNESTPDPQLPISGSAMFYLFHDSQGFGDDGRGHTRVADSGSCSAGP